MNIKKSSTADILAQLIRDTVKQAHKAKAESPANRNMVREIFKRCGEKCTETDLDYIFN